MTGVFGNLRAENQGEFRREMFVLFENGNRERPSKRAALIVFWRKSGQVLNGGQEALNSKSAVITGG